MILEGRDGYVLPVSLALRVGLLKQPKHSLDRKISVGQVFSTLKYYHRVFYVTNEVIFADLDSRFIIKN